MTKKDFLSQFSNDDKPDSFKEEERIKVVKERKPVNVKLVVILIILLILLGLGSYFLFFAPKIQMPNFVGKNKSDVSAWVKQQQIETSGIVFDENYDFETSEGTILSQSVDEGIKVKKDVKITFEISKGANPNEEISVPNLESMSKEDIQAWISENKLTKTKVTSVYSDTVEEGKVIEVKFTNCDESTFVRNSTLSISISKGVEPAKEIKMPNVVGKKKTDLSTLETQYKIKFDIKEDYSDTVDEGVVISQEVKAGEKVLEGTTVTVTVSKGKAIYMPNMYEWSKEDIITWAKKNGVVISEYKERYGDEVHGECVGQSPKAGTKLEDDDYIYVTISLGDPDIGTSSFKSISNIDVLRDRVDQLNDLGAALSISASYEFSDEKEGTILDMSDHVETGGTIYVTVSKGRNIWLENEYSDGSETYKWSDINVYNEAQIRKLCELSGVNYRIEYQTSKTVEANYVISVYIDGTKNVPSGGMYVAENTDIVVTICEKKVD